jgi:outer membrane protein OmpA-like peptidoglycan-associated protein
VTEPPEPPPPPPNETPTGQLRKLLGDVSEKALAALLTAGGFVTFVVVAGGAIVWARFYAAKLPADQAVDALPDGELVVVGAVSLILFGVLGLLAMITVYLLDRAGRPRRSMTYGLLAILVVEAVAASALAVDDLPWERFALALESIALVAGASLLVTRTRRFVRLGGQMDPTGAERDADLPLEPAVPNDLADALLRREEIALGAACVVAAAGLAAWLPEGDDAWWGRIALLLAGVLVGAVATFGARWIRTDPATSLHALERPGEHAADRPRYRPRRFRLTRAGRLVMLGLAVVAIVAPALAVGQQWVAIGIAAAVVLACANWAIANSTASFAWYGIAVLASVPLFGAILSVARVLDDAEIQPMALVRERDGRQEILEGIYIAETDDRVYFGSVVARGCEDELLNGRGEISRVPRKEVAAMSIGPVQAVDAAARQSGDLRRQAAATASADVAVPWTPPEPKVPGIRGEGGLRLKTATAAPGDRVTITGHNLDGPANPEKPRREDRVEVGGVPAHVVSWTNRSITFEVPERPADTPAPAGASLVTVRCPQPLEPLPLTVKGPPEARLDVLTAASGRRAALSSTGSIDPGGTVVERAWKVDGRDAGTTQRTDARIGAGPEDATTAELTVRDDDGNADTASVVAARLPAVVLFDAAGTELSARGRQELRRLRTRVADAASIVIHGFADDPGGEAANDDIARARAKAVEEALFEGLPHPPPDVEREAFGRRCLDPRRSGARASNGRVDVFFLSEGAGVTPPCAPLRP